MAELNTRPDSINVEQIMQQLRARIRERRGADYTESELQQLAGARLEQLLEARGAGSAVGQRFLHPPPPAPDLPGYAFEDSTLFATHRGPLGALRRLLRPILKLFFNPDPLSRALHVQAQLNGEFQRRLRLREEMDPMLAEVVRGLVLEVTRASLEVQSLKMRLESLATRLDFEERRARNRDLSPPPAQPRPPQSAAAPAGGDAGAGPTLPNRTDLRTGEGAAGTGARRRRRRRRRRPGGPADGQAPSEAWQAERTGEPSVDPSPDADDGGDDFSSSDAVDDVSRADTDEP